RAFIPSFVKAAPDIGRAFMVALNAALGGLPTLFAAVGRYSAWAFREGIMPIIRSIGSSISGAAGRARGGIMAALFPSTSTARAAVRTFMSGVGRAIVEGYDRFIAGQPIFRGRVGALFSGFGNAVSLISREIAGMFMRITPGAVNMVRDLASSIRQAFVGTGDLLFGPQFMSRVQANLGKVAAAIKNFMTPRGMGIVANPKAFAAFDAMADSVDRIAKRASKFKTFGSVFDDLGKMVIKAAKPFMNVSGAMEMLGRS